MADMFGASDRGKSLDIVMLLPYLGLVVGGPVTQLVYWRWLFCIVSIAGTRPRVVWLVC